MIKKTYNFDEKYIQDPPPPKKKKIKVEFSFVLQYHETKILILLEGEKAMVCKNLQSLFTKQSRLEYARRKLFLNINDLFYINI